MRHRAHREYSESHLENMCETFYFPVKLAGEDKKRIICKRAAEAAGWKPLPTNTHSQRTAPIRIPNFFLLCIFRYRRKSSGKIKRRNSTVQVVCDKAPLSGRQSVVIASVPPPRPPSINSAKELSERSPFARN